MEGSCVHFEQKPVEPQPMTVVKNPFLVTLPEESADLSVTYNDGLKIRVVGQNSFWMVYYWGVNVNVFHENLKLNWDSMKQSILEGSFLEKACLDKSSAELVTDAIDGKDVQVKTSKPVKAEDLGMPPRACFPLVLFLLLNEDDTDGEMKDDDVVVMSLVIHVKDQVCQMQTSIISQYLKQKNGNVLTLQSLYTPQVSSEASGESAPLCVVCQESAVSRALLPCRHTCVCAECYDKIDKCPLCRSYIHSFFKIREETVQSTSQTLPEEESQPAEPRTSGLSSRLYSWLGLR